MHAKSLQLCPTFCDPLDCIPPASSVHGILQARILKWVAMPSSRGSSQPKNQTPISMSPASAGRLITASATWEALINRLTGNLYLLTTFIQFPCPSTSNNQKSDLFFYGFVCLKCNWPTIVGLFLFLNFNLLISARGKVNRNEWYDQTYETLKLNIKPLPSIPQQTAQT